MTSAWRLLTTPPASGPRNMAIDEAILESVAAGGSPPTLRFYAWHHPCLSLGHAQSADVVDPQALAAAGWGWVRRPTGGRALLHADELTYSIVTPDRHPAVAGGVLASYRELSRGLLGGLERLGLVPDPPAYTPVSEADRSNPMCFEVPSAYEITVGGRKLIGSAQLRRRGAVLQHGSLPLDGDITRVARVLRYRDETQRRTAAERLGRHAGTLRVLLGRAVSWEQAAQAIQAGFEDSLGWDLFPDELSTLEDRCAQRLEVERYCLAEPARAA